jgi:predicted nucleotidyltransferase
VISPGITLIAPDRAASVFRMDPRQLDEMRAALVVRQEAAARAAVERARQARALLPVIVARLRDTFGARRIVLFGSLARGDFGLESDIDLLVTGIAAERFFHACAAIDRLADPFEVDLVPEESAPASTRDAAGAGEVLLDAA